MVIITIVVVVFDVPVDEVIEIKKKTPRVPYRRIPHVSPAYYHARPSPATRVREIEASPTQYVYTTVKMKKINL